MENNVIEDIRSQYSVFSKGQKRIAEYVINNCEKVAYMTAAKLGATVGVSESTVVRFAAELGFSGYPEFLKTLREFVPTKLNSLQRINLANSSINECNVLEQVIQSDIDNLKKTLANNNRDDFNGAVNATLGADTIYILGVRSSASLASFLGFNLNLMFPQVKLIQTTSVSEMFEQVLHVDERDVVIGISFPRYSRRTVKALNYAKSCNAKVIAITDSPRSPLAAYSDYALYARSDMVSFADSLVAPLSLINALIAAVSIKKRDELSKTFEKLEYIWEEYEVYDKGEMSEKI